MADQSSANDPVAERPPETAASAESAPPAHTSAGWTPVPSGDPSSGWTPAPPLDWAGSPPPPPAAVRTPGNTVAAIVLLVVGVGLLIWGIPAVIVHIRAATGSLGSIGEMPPTGNFIRVIGAFLGFFLTFTGVGALIKVMRNSRD